MADVKKKENGKWTVVDDKGKIYPNAGEFNTKEKAADRLKQMEGHKAHKEETSAERKKKHALLDSLVNAADLLDKSGKYDNARELDKLAKTIIAGDPMRDFGPERCECDTQKGKLCTIHKFSISSAMGDIATSLAERGFSTEAIKHHMLSIAKQLFG